MSVAGHKKYLKVSAVVIGSFAPLFTLGASGSELLAEPIRLTFDLLSLSYGEHSFLAPTTRFCSALTGGFLAGFGATVWALSGAAFDSNPEAIRKAVVTGASFWVILDSIGSTLAGYPSNVVFNALVYAAVVGPLWWPAPDAPSVAEKKQ